LDNRRTRSDLIETYKILNEVYDIPKNIFFTYNTVGCIGVTTLRQEEAVASS